jgi:hypothetical protein
VSTLLLVSFYPSPLAPHNESTSSIKIILGFFSLAILNKVLINFSLSPTYLLIKSLEETLKKVPEHSVAHALAINVLPVPGGPYIRIPFQGFNAPWKIYGNFIGKITASFNIAFALSRPAISSHFTFGFAVTIASPKESLNF